MKIFRKFIVNIVICWVLLYVFNYRAYINEHTINITKDIQEEIDKLNAIYAPLPGYISTIPFKIYC